MDRSELLHLVEEAVEADENVLSGSEDLETLDGWDSMAVLSFLALVDERYGVTLPPKKLEDCRIVDDLISLIEQHVVQA